ncbi:unnamed protein product [Prorocentrum cordatum]|uniref:Uncharacterized protein n=1 Tax=Prorocentrum cordatum TaxID=2364126 RepID=A0ABN9Q539_9DINO|nr:unnamed protein product [Polarella glacialis]
MTTLTSTSNSDAADVEGVERIIVAFGVEGQDAKRQDTSSISRRRRTSSARCRRRQPNPARRGDTAEQRPFARVGRQPRRGPNPRARGRLSFTTSPLKVYSSRLLRRARLARKAHGLPAEIGDRQERLRVGHKRVPRRRSPRRPRAARRRCRPPCEGPRGATAPQVHRVPASWPPTAGPATGCTSSPCSKHASKPGASHAALPAVRSGGSPWSPPRMTFRTAGINSCSSNLPSSLPFATGPATSMPPTRALGAGSRRLHACGALARPAPRPAAGRRRAASARRAARNCAWTPARPTASRHAQANGARAAQCPRASPPRARGPLEPSAGPPDRGATSRSHIQFPHQEPKRLFALDLSSCLLRALV